MMANLSEMARLLAIPLENHLWQSTLFGLAVACLTLSLRKNEARLRFGAWFLASAKFLLPLALLAKVGSTLGAHVAGPTQSSFISVIDVVGQPFARSSPGANDSPAWWDQLSTGLPVCIAALWITGTLAILVLWYLRWSRVVRRQELAAPVAHGVEADLLRSLEPVIGIDELPILLCEEHVEPGVFGIFRPVLLWPANFSNELTEPQLWAILAHEAWHVRRRDNITAGVQMLIEAVFWFHPLVWWFGSRQMEERERACDEGVLALGSVPAAYAESILKTCRFCVEAPLPCVAGVNGSNLKKRISRIMGNQDITALTTTKRLVFSSLALAAIGLPVVLGVTSSRTATAQIGSAAVSYSQVHITGLKKNTSGTAMSKVTYTPEGTVISNTTVRSLIELAYSLKTYELTGGPSWLDSDRFDITYTGGEPPTGGHVPGPNVAMKEILSQRFHLVLRQETKPGTILALVVGREASSLLL